MSARALEMWSAISIHALREEGDQAARATAQAKKEFLSTPSARRATTVHGCCRGELTFLSTPSARRATRNSHGPRWLDMGFLSTPSARRATIQTAQGARTL